MPYKNLADRTRYDMQYQKEHIKRISFNVQQTYFNEVLKPTCDKLGLPVNTFIKQAIEHEIVRVSQKSPDCNTDAGSEF